MAEPLGFGVDFSHIQRLARQYPEISAEESVAVMRVIVARLENEVVGNTPAGVGGSSGLRGSINGEVVLRTGEIIGLVGSPLAHAAPVEYGTRPHFPPARPIILWAARKLGLSGRELRSAVRGIQWKIYQHGTEGAHMFDKSFKNLDSWIMAQVETIPDRIAGRANNGEN
ncbi:MAG: HK97 gp10 family phage protein [Thermodesulfobacteriota bacterium]